MPIQPTYPGIYIEELPSSAHTITAAPTSITVFVGYTHPFKTKSFGKAVQLFSFTDYEREFGGLFTSDAFDSNLANAVNQFFLNGGSNAYVIGVSPGNGGQVTNPTVTAPTATIDNTIEFTALEPTDQHHRMKVTISKPSSPGIADVTITYSRKRETVQEQTIRTETFRRVTFDTAASTDARINQVSSIVTVAPAGGGSTYSALSDQEQSQTFGPTSAPTHSSADVIHVFDDDSDLDKLPIFNLLVLPGIADNSVWSAALAFCERKRAFLIMDPPAQAIADPDSRFPNFSMAEVMDSGIVPPSTNGALYFPYLQSIDPLTGESKDRPPSGFVAGIYARTDANRGVWKAPAGLETTILNTTGVAEQGRMTDMRQGTLNDLGVNCLRTFPGVGTVVFGSRTLVTKTNEQWRYVSVRRMALFIEQTLYDALKWVIHEPNDEPLWVAIRTSIENFMLSLYQQGAFQGSTPSQAFQVKCDASTTTQTDINNGIVNIIVAFAPLKPAEFVIVKIAQLAGQAQV